MKRFFIAFLYLLLPVCSLAGEFYVLKVNRIEKMWVIPPDRRNFIGSRGIQKFDYARPICSEEQGEHYVVTWRYRGEELTEPVVLRFEYYNKKGRNIEEKSYTNLKSGTYKWIFKNVGNRFFEEGKVDRWKVSLILDGDVVAMKRSSTWFAMEGT